MTTSTNTPGSEIRSGADAPRRRDDQAQTVGKVMGERQCVHCNHNLASQPIQREPHYQLLIVRCPECGEVSSLQEYPVLGRWGKRLGAVIAAVFMLKILGLWVGTGMAVMGFCIGVSEEGTRDFSQLLDQKFNEDMGTDWWSFVNGQTAVPFLQGVPAFATVNGVVVAGAVSGGVAQEGVDGGVDGEHDEGDEQAEVADGQMESQVESDGDASPQAADGGVEVVNDIGNDVGDATNPQGGAQVSMEILEARRAKWLADLDMDAMIASGGGFFRVIDDFVYFLWLFLPLACLPLGMMWSLILIGRRARWMPVAALVLLALPAMICIVVVLGQQNSTIWGLHQVAENELVPRLMAITLAIAFVPLWIGLLIGRPLARTFVRLVMPPPLLPMMTWLWVWDRKTPPLAKRA